MENFSENSSIYSIPRFPSIEDFDIFSDEGTKDWEKAQSDFDAALSKWLEGKPATKALIFKESSKYGDSYKAVTRDPGGCWRTTSFNTILEMPMGHEEFPTRLDAVRSVAGWDQIEKLPFTVKAGEFHSSTTPFVWLKDNANPYPIQVCFGGYLAGGVRAEVWKESEGRGKCFQVSVEDLSLSNPQKDREIQKIEKIESLPLSQQVFQKDATQCHSVGGR